MSRWKYNKNDQSEWRIENQDLYNKTLKDELDRNNDLFLYLQSRLSELLTRINIEP